MKFSSSGCHEYPLMANRPSNGQHLTPFHDLYRQGVRLFHVDATITEDIYHPELRAWVAADQFDYSAQEKYWQKLLQGCPDAKLCLRIYVASPPWWDAQNPDELQVYSDGSVEREFQRTSRRTIASVASKKWLQCSEDAMERFIAWLKKSGWQERVWGLFLCYGITWEWGLLGSDGFPDYSSHMQNQFHVWLKDFYKTDENLQKAWNNPHVTFDNAKIPSKEDRLRCDGHFRVFPRDRAAYDFQRCLSDANTNYLLLLGKAVRKHAKNQYALGTFYGYTLTAREQNEFTGLYGAGGFHGGHHALKKVYESGLFDFLGSPYVYLNRQLGEGVFISHIPQRSTEEHGIHTYIENDLYTHLMPSERNDIPLPSSRASSPGLTIYQQRLALAHALCTKSSYWWTELSDWIGPYVENYGDENILKELRSHVEIFQQAETSGRHTSSVAQIALILDEEAIDALGLSSALFMDEVYNQLNKWAWCGAPFDVWLASDITAKRMEPYKLAYVFAPYIPMSGRARYRDALCHSGRTVLWGRYTGLLTENGIDPAAFYKLTGFEDPNEEKIHFKTMSGWTSIHGSCASMTAKEIASCAAHANVHLYGNAPLYVEASEHFLLIHAREAGEYAIKPFRQGKWSEIFTKKLLSEEPLTFQDREVCLFQNVSYSESI